MSLVLSMVTDQNALAAGALIGSDLKIHAFAAKYAHEVTLQRQGP